MMKTTHRLLAGDARTLDGVPAASVHLVVTSPPYPMVAMWDETFRRMSHDAAVALDAGDGAAAFEAMHVQLDRVWRSCARVLVPGGLLCVNIGDATRTVDGTFQLFPNHARVLQAAMAQGLTVLPDVLWHKPTNSPTKFMGSGMLPAGAYVTYEHEYVLILRKGPRRTFRGEDAAARRRSAFFWEERNAWFSDLWRDLRGTRQRLDAAARKRSGAYPLELPLRLILMHSLQGEVVLDPFAGTGTTEAAALATGRSSVGVEWDESLLPHRHAALESAVAEGAARARARQDHHAAFVAARSAAARPTKHHNPGLDVPVVTSQERSLVLTRPVSLGPERDSVRTAHHAPLESSVRGG
ncbi:MAG: site-specific DNA-methyltransferase [Myxococcota bacterium]|nr:site-specific DNA-methyltransferase [Myxococcota bacterium]